MTNALFQRYAIGFSVGALIAVALLYIMQAVISSDDQHIEKARVFAMNDWVRVIEDEPLEVKTPLPQKPPKPDEVPPEIPREAIDKPTWGAPVGPTPPPTTTDGPGVAGRLTDGDFIRLVQVRPVYPRSALARGIEGFVLVEFCITESGVVRDPFVVLADPPTIFNRSALDAATRAKFKPRIENEIPMEVCGVLTRIVFEMED